MCAFTCFAIIAETKFERSCKFMGPFKWPYKMCKHIFEETCPKNLHLSEVNNFQILWQILKFNKVPF